MKMAKNLLFFLFGLILFINQNSAAQDSAPSFALSDLTILMPLPDINEWDELLSPTSKENLLPWSLFEMVPFLINQKNEITYRDLRVIGIRIDPCFIEGFGPQPCQRQIRFVWQPLQNTTNQTSTIDATLHTFFNLDQNRFDQFLQKYQNMIKTHQRLFTNELAVHPTILRQGLKGEYWNHLKSLLLDTIQNLQIQKMTFMKLKGMNDIWIFGGFKLENNFYQAIDIAGLPPGNQQQDFINSMAIRPHPKQFNGGVFPSPDETAFFYKVLTDSLELEQSTEDEVISFLKTSVDFENPQLHNPGTLDCVSCHLASTSRAFAIEQKPGLKLADLYEDLKFKTYSSPKKHNLGSYGETNLLRMLGYFEQRPLITERVVNETAVILDSLNLSRLQKK